MRIITLTKVENWRKLAFRPQFPRRKAVTIIAGFKSYEGVVLCADSQETLESSKRNVPKIRFEPSDSQFGAVQESVDDLGVAFCGAGDGAFIDKLASNAWEKACTATSIDEACSLIEKSIKATYKEFGEIFQTGSCPEVQLIYGVKMHHESRLFSAIGPIVNEKQGYDCGGTGHYMASFLASRMYGDHLPVHQCVILAAYILFQAKEHVEGCGGESQVVVLRKHASSGAIDWKRLEVITKLLSLHDENISNLLLKSANLNISDEQLSSELKNTTTIINAMRESQREELENHESMSRVLSGDQAPTDVLGLPTPLGGRTLESEP
jgi:20S proteasome alpha/beta subunit